MICVYAPDSTDFSGNGLGPVSPLSCTVTETLNGEWELTLEHPLDETGKWRRLVEGCILRAPVPAAMTPGITMITQATPEVRREIWKVRTNGSRLMLRSGTGTRYKIIGKYKNGTEVVLLEKTTSSWYKMLTPDGKQGYMSTDWLQYVRTEVTPGQGEAVNEVVEARQLRDQPFQMCIRDSFRACDVHQRPRQAGQFDDAGGRGRLRGRGAHRPMLPFRPHKDSRHRRVAQGQRQSRLRQPAGRLLLRPNRQPDQF